MKNRVIVPWLLATTVVLSSVSVHAFITAELRLDQLLKDSSYAFVARIAELDSAKPAMVLRKTADLREASPFDRIPVLLTGDTANHTPQLLKRLAVDLSIVVVVSKDQAHPMMLAYSNGTWFQLIGHEDDGRTRWEFTHCEIYLRRMFNGSTEELQALIPDVLAKKRKAPRFNSKEPPGMGPEIGQ